jgi:hypothetical protein
VADGVADGLDLWCAFAEPSTETVGDVPEREDGVADDFGSINGTEILNKSTILAEIDAALGVDSPPAVEYLLVFPPRFTGCPFRSPGSDWIGIITDTQPFDRPTRSLLESKR